MADWVTISSLATAGGTLVLAGTTYASVRSANRASRMAEQSLLVGLRPLLFPSKESDPPQRVGFVDGVEVVAPGGGAGITVVDGRAYLAFSLRNVGPGLAVIHGGVVHAGPRRSSVAISPMEEFRMLQRDLYVPAGEIGFWQIAYRDDDRREEVLRGIDEGRLTIEVLYGDSEGGQRVVSRFGVIRHEDGSWEVSPVRHWQVDRADPR